MKDRSASTICLSKGPRSPFVCPLCLLPRPPSLGFFRALPALKRNTPPRKLLSEVSSLFASAAWKQHMNAKRSSHKTASLCIAVFSSHVPWPFQSNPTIWIKIPKFFSWAPQILHLPSLSQPRPPCSQCKVSFKPTLYSAPACCKPRLLQRGALAHRLWSSMAQETPGPGKVGFQLPLGNTLPAIPWMAARFIYPGR